MQEQFFRFKMIFNTLDSLFQEDSAQRGRVVYVHDRVVIGRRQLSHLFGVVALIRWRKNKEN